jgi:tetratricopeptide (TPR) repeat protein
LGYVANRFIARAYLKGSLLRALNRYRAAVEREDIAAMRQDMNWVISSVDGSTRPAARAIAEWHKAMLLVDMENFQDGMLTLAGIQRDALPKLLHRALLWRLAWCKANTGEPEEAVLLTREALDQPGSQLEKALIHALRGAALFYAGRSQEALPPLSEALADELSPYNRACAEHYLGLSLESLSRSEEARAAFERSVGAFECKWARRSREHLLQAH